MTMNPEDFHDMAEFWAENCQHCLFWSREEGCCYDLGLRPANWLPDPNCQVFLKTTAGRGVANA
jgi:hypothetical protein